MDRSDCVGLGATNTINRAEVCAGMHCLERAGLEMDEVLATDSQVTMCSLNRHLRSPMLNRFSKHKALLDAMSACVLERARRGLHTTIVKVKSHVGIEGNEKADELAKEATEPVTYPCHATIQVGSVAYQDICWPYSSPPRKAEDTPAAREEASTAVANLTSCLKDVARRRFQTGHTNHTLYTNL